MIRKIAAILLFVAIAVSGMSSIAFAADGGEDINVSGLKTSISGKAGKKLTDAITISPAAKYTVKLQKKKDNSFETQKTFTTADDGKVTLIYPKQWYTKEKSTWRLLIDATWENAAYTSKNIAVKAKRVYQTPGKYYKVHDSQIKLEGGGYTVSRGYTGLKTKKINNYFHIGSKTFPRYTQATASRVKTFQKKHSLKATGKVNKATWLAMGFSEDAWYNIGAYTSPLKAKTTSTRKQLVNIMVKRAKQYKKAGARYVDGASGTPKQGCDCSGLVMQCLYAAGINPLPSSTVRHSRPGYDYESRYLYKSKKFKRVKLRNIKKGDLVFYKNSGGTIIHVALYIGRGKCIESVNYGPGGVVQWRLNDSRRFGSIAGVRRPLP